MPLANRATSLSKLASQLYNPVERGGGMESHRKRILCVDDDIDTLALYAMMFYDYEVLTETTVAETLMRARNCLVDLYLFDAWLPDGSGLRLCREIRKFDPNTPILFVSGAVDQSDQDQAI